MPEEIHAICEMYLVCTRGLLMEFQNELLQFIRFLDKVLATCVIYILTSQKKLIMCMQIYNLDSAEITSLIEQTYTVESKKLKSFIEITCSSNFDN